jgi:hypothetical protein
MAKMQGYPIHGSARLRLSWARNPSDKVMEHVRKLVSLLVDQKSPLLIINVQSHALGIRKLTVHLAIEHTLNVLAAFEEVYKMVQGTDRSLIKQFANAVSPNNLATSPTSPFGGSFNLPDPYPQRSSSSHFSSPASAYPTSFRGSASLLSSQGTPSSFASSSIGSPHSNLFDSFSSLSMSNSPNSFVGSPATSQGGLSPVCNTGRSSFARGSGVVGFF